MSGWELAGLRLSGGQFDAVLRGPDGPAPDLRLALPDSAGEAVRLAPLAPGQWRMTAALPVAALSDGLVPLRFSLGDGETVATYLVAAGQATGDASTAVLEAELRMLRRAFLDFAADPPLRAAERAAIVAEAVERAAALLPPDTDMP